MDKKFHASAEDLEAHVRRLAQYIGERNLRRPDALLRAALYIEQTLADAGYLVQREYYDISERGVHNLIAETEPIYYDRPFLLIGAHYDTAEGTPGADDNASGAAVLLETAKALKQFPPPIAIRFAAFCSEEPPYFDTPDMGSAVHAKRIKKKEEKLIGMLSLEMLGYYSEKVGSQSYPPFLRFFYPSTGNFLALVSNRNSRPFLAKLQQALSKGEMGIESAALPAWVPGVGLSDHASFWKEGFPAAMLTDTAMFRNPNYHRPTDTPETLDYEGMAEITEALVSMLRSWQ